MKLYRVSVAQEDVSQPNTNILLSAPSARHALVAGFILDGGTDLESTQPFNELVALSIQHASVEAANPEDREECNSED